MIDFTAVACKLDGADGEDKVEPSAPDSEGPRQEASVGSQECQSCEACIVSDTAVLCLAISASTPRKCLIKNPYLVREIFDPRIPKPAMNPCWLKMKA